MFGNPVTNPHLKKIKEFKKNKGYAKSEVQRKKYIHTTKWKTE